VKGRFLRRGVPGAPRYPTSTYMPDPYAVRSGDFLLLHHGYEHVTHVHEFGDGVRFAQTTNMLAVPGGAVVHDLRDGEPAS